MKIAFLTLGCKLNYAETSTYERSFISAGWTIVKPNEKADVYLVNTCSVTATSDAKSRNLVRKVHRINPDARIVVTGCSAQLRKSELEKIEGVARVFGAGEKHLVVPQTIALAEGHSNVNIIDSMPGCFPAFSTGERTRSFLKVQDGCDNFCAYCTVPYARGESRNVPICECVKNAEAIAASGACEIVLTGVNTGDFGKTTGESFLDLLKALQKVEGISRYRISSIEPNLLTSDVIDWIASEGNKFQPHFHIPLQSGSDRILKLMGRHYDTAFFSSKISEVRNALEKEGGLRVFFGIDLMVGLPTESDEDFDLTLNFLRDVKPAFIHVFPYSKRPGTPAAAMEGQVSDQVKEQRVKAIENLCEELHSDFEQQHRGMKARVLFESKDKNGMMSGYTENYIRISRPFDAALVGKITDVII